MTDKRRRSGVKKFPMTTDDKKTNENYLNDNRYVEFENNCEETIYMHIEWPYGAITNFVLRPGETHALYVGTGEPPCGCASRRGPITDCGDECNPITGGEYYEFC